MSRLITIRKDSRHINGVFIFFYFWTVVIMDLMVTSSPDMDGSLDDMNEWKRDLNMGGLLLKIWPDEHHVLPVEYSNYHKLPVYFTINKQWHPITNLQLDYANRVSQPFKGYDINCNTEFTMQKFFGKEMNTPISSEITDDHWTYWKTFNLELTVGARGFRIGHRDISVTGISEILTSRFYFDEVFECMYQGLPTIDPRYDVNGAIMLHHNLLLAGQTKAFYWDNTNKAHYSNSLATDQWADNVLTCTGCNAADGDNTTAAVYTNDGCSCSIKSGVIDIVYEIQDLINKVYDVDLGFLVLGQSGNYRTLKGLIVRWSILGLGYSLYNPRPKGSYWYASIPITRFLCCVMVANHWVWLWGRVATLSDYCRIGENPNPIAGDQIREYLPGWDCRHSSDMRTEAWGTGWAALILLCSLWWKNNAAIGPNTTEQKRFTICNRGLNLTFPLFKFWYGIFHNMLFMAGLISGSAFYSICIFPQLKYRAPNDYIDLPWKWNTIYGIYQCAGVVGMTFCVTSTFWGMIELRGVITTKVHDMAIKYRKLSWSCVIALPPSSWIMRAVLVQLDIANVTEFPDGSGRMWSHPTSGGYAGSIIGIAARGPSVYHMLGYLTVMQTIIGRGSRIIYGSFKWLTIITVLAQLGGVLVYLSNCGGTPYAGMQPHHEYVVATHTGEQIPPGFDKGDLCALDGWMFNLPKPTRLMNNYNRSKVYFGDGVYDTVYGVFDQFNATNHIEDRTLMMTKDENGTYLKDWHSTYHDDLISTCNYASMQIISTAGLGDIPPMTPSERMLVNCFTLVAIILIQTKFLNTLTAFVEGKVAAKQDYIRSIIGTWFIYADDDAHRVDRSQSVLCTQWNLWGGLMPLSENSVECKALPRSIKQEMTSSILLKLLETRRSTILSQMNAGDINTLSEHLHYQLIPKGDMLLNSIESAQYVVIIYSGCMNMVDHNNNVIGETGPEKVHYETECFLGMPLGFSLVSETEYTEVFTLDRKIFLHAIHLNKDLHETILRRLGRVAKVHERVVEEQVVSVPVRTKNLQGLPTPLLAKNECLLPKLSDILNYLHKTKEFTLDPVTLTNREALDSDTGSLLDTANSIYQYNVANNTNAMLRTSKRADSLQMYHNEAAEHSLIDIRLKSISMINQEHPKAFFSDSNRLSRAIGNRTSNQRMSRASLNRAALEGIQDSMDPHAVASQFSKLVIPVDSNAPDHMDYGHLMHGKIQNQPTGFKFIPGSPAIVYWENFYSIFCLIGIFVITTQYAFFAREDSEGNDANGIVFFIVNYLLIDSVILINWAIILNTAIRNEEHAFVWSAKKVWDSKSNSTNYLRVAATIPWEFLLMMRGGTFSASFMPGRFFKAIYFMVHVHGYLRSKSIELYGSSFRMVYQYLFPIFLTIQGTTCLNYYVTCIWDGKCSIGSWAWELFGEHYAGTNDSLIITSGFERWGMTLYWKSKIYTTFNHGNILPGFASSRSIMFYEMYAGVIFLLFITALVTTSLLMNPRQQLIADFKAHWFTVLTRISDINSSLSKRVMTVKHILYNNSCGMEVPGCYEVEDNVFQIDRAIIKEKSAVKLTNTTPIFTGLPTSIRLQMALKMKKFQYPPGQVIAKAGDKSSSIYLINAGTCKVTAASGAHAGQCLGYLEAGQVFNALEFLGDVATQWNVEAHTACEICEWSKDAFTETLANFLPWQFDKMAQGNARQHISTLNLLPNDVDEAALTVSAEAGVILALGKASDDFYFDSTSDKYMYYSVFRVVRILFTIICATAYYGFLYKSSGMLIAMILLDIFAFVDIGIYALTARTNPITNMPIRKASSNIQYYVHNGLIWDLIASFPFYTYSLCPPLILLRVLQLRRAREFFLLLKNSIDINPAFFVSYWIYLQICVLHISSAIMFSIACYEGKSAADGDVVELNLGSAEDQAVVRIPKTSWVGTALVANEEETGFKLCTFQSSPSSIYCLAIYFISDCMTGVGAGHMYPTSNISKVWEFATQIIGWSLNCIVAAEFSSQASIADLVRSDYETDLYTINAFFNNAGLYISDGIKNTIRTAYNMTWKHKTGPFEAFVFKGLPSQLVTEISIDMYSETLRETFIGHEDTLESIAPHIQVLSTVAETYIENYDALCFYGYFVREGDFEVHDASGNVVEILRKGCHFIPKERSEFALYCLTEGSLLTVPLDEINFKIPQARLVEKIPLTLYMTGTNLVIQAGIYLFLDTVYETFFQSSVIEGSIRAKWLFILKAGLFLYIWGTTGYKKFKSEKIAFNLEEYIILIASFPLPKISFHDIRMYQYFLWYIMLQFNYQRKMDNIHADAYIQRLIKYGNIALLIIYGFMCTQITYLCPAGVCKSNSMAQEMYGLFELNTTTNTMVQAKDISGTATLIDNFYVVLSLFSATGHGNILSQSEFMLILSSINCLLGRICMGMTLGLAKDVTDSAIEGTWTNYAITRERIKQMFRSLKVREWTTQYILGWWDANFLRCHHKSIQSILGKDQVVAPANIADLVYELFGEKIHKQDIFQGISVACMKEICLRAADLNNYFSGHVIQNQGCTVDGLLLVLSGSVLIGKHGVVIAGEHIFAEHYFDRHALADRVIYAFTFSEIITLNEDSMAVVFKHYPDDEATFKANMVALVGK